MNLPIPTNAHTKAVEWNNMKNIIIATVFALLIIQMLFSKENESLERSRAQYWKAEYERLWAFSSMVEIPVRNLIPGTIRFEERK